MQSGAVLSADHDLRIVDLVASEGTASARWPRALPTSRNSRDLADAMHVLCVTYGIQPGLLDVAKERVDDPALAGWIGRAAVAFAVERAVMGRMAAAVGPAPSTPGQAQAEAAIAAQRHALDTLAHSDRAGCAIGAAAALALDWHAVRDLVDRIAAPLGVALPRCDLPGEEPPLPPAATAGVTRARLFGARQLLVQQRGLWTLLESRAQARAGR